MWGKLNSRAVNQKGEEIMSNQKAAYYRGVVDYFMGDQLLKVGASVEKLGRNKELAEAIYKNIYFDLRDKYFNPMLDKADKGEQIDQEVAEDLYKILSNWEDFVQYHKKESKLFVRIPGELAIDVPENPEDQTDDTEIGQDNYEIREEDNEVEGDTPEERESEFSDKLYDRAGNEISSMDGVTANETRGLIRMLPEVEFKNGKFDIKLDRNEFPKLCDYAKTWNNLAYNLAGSSTYKEMYDKMTNPKVMKKIPELFVLTQHLPDPDKEMSFYQFKNAISFRTSFDRSYVGIYSGRIYSNPDGSMTYFLREETKRNADQVSKLWTANFNNKLTDSPEVTGAGILIDPETGRYYINPNYKLSFNLKDKNERERLINFIGFSFSDDTKRQPVYDSSEFPRTLKCYSKENINQRNELGYKIFNPVF